MGRRGRRVGRGHQHRHPGRQPAHRLLPVGLRHRRRGGRHPDGRGLQRRPESLATSTSTRRPADAVERATRLLGATKPRSAPPDRGVRAPDHRHAAGRSWPAPSTASRCSKGRSLFADRLGEEVSVPGLTLVDDPTDPEAYGATRFDAEGLATRRNVLIDDGVLQTLPVQHLLGPPGRDPFDRVGGAGRLQERPGYRRPGARRRARRRSRPEEILAGVGDGLLVQSVSGIHSGVNPVSGDFSVGAEGVMIRGRGAGRTGAGVHHRLDHPAHAAAASWPSASTSSGCPSSAAGRDAGHRRHVDERGMSTTFGFPACATRPSPDREQPDVFTLRRQAARVVLLDDRDRVLLLQASDPADPAKGSWWEIPGGGIEGGEADRGRRPPGALRGDRHRRRRDRPVRVAPARHVRLRRLPLRPARAGARGPLRRAASTDRPGWRASRRWRSRGPAGGRWPSCRLWTVAAVRE